MLFFLVVLTWFSGASAPVDSQPVPQHVIHRVVIDAGHGGKDFGAVSPNGLREKNLTLEVARRVSDDLRARGIEVVMTRNKDVFIPLANRAKVTNKKGVDLFISIHANASLSKSLKGFEVYYLSEAADDLALAVERAENSALHFESAAVEVGNENLNTILWDLRESENRRESIRLANAIGNAALHSVPIEARRIRSANFYVLKWSESPAVLVEMGYLTNHQDENKLKNSHYRRKLAAAVVKGILNFKQQFDQSNGFTA